MADKKECLPFNEESSAFLKGYWDGYLDRGHKNPYTELSPDWVQYELGWEEGWLDS